MPLLARTIVLNCGHNAGKKLFANQKGQEYKIIKTLCAIKAMVTWNTEKTTRICRERIGGGSFLDSSLIGQSIFSAHAGMTAEGDNSVLMQKVVKDILEHSRQGKHQMPKIPAQRLKKIA